VFPGVPFRIRVEPNIRAPAAELSSLCRRGPSSSRTPLPSRRCEASAASTRARRVAPVSRAPDCRCRRQFRFHEPPRCPTWLTPRLLPHRAGDDERTDDDGHAYWQCRHDVEAQYEDAHNETRAEQPQGHFLGRYHRPEDEGYPHPGLALWVVGEVVRCPQQQSRARVADDFESNELTQPVGPGAIDLLVLGVIERLHLGGLRGEYSLLR